MRGRWRLLGLVVIAELACAAVAWWRPAGRAILVPAASDPVPLRLGEIRGKTAVEMIHSDGVSPADAIESYGAVKLRPSRKGEP
jgi:hypothetical protein